MFELNFVDSSCSSLELFVLLNPDIQFSIERFEPTVSQSTVSSSPLKVSDPNFEPAPSPSRASDCKCYRQEPAWALSCVPWTSPGPSRGPLDCCGRARERMYAHTFIIILIIIVMYIYIYIYIYTCIVYIYIYIYTHIYIHIIHIYV